MQNATAKQSLGGSIGNERECRGTRGRRLPPEQMQSKKKSVAM